MFHGYSDLYVPAVILKGLTSLLGKLTGLFHSLGQWVSRAPSLLESDLYSSRVASHHFLILSSSPFCTFPAVLPSLQEPVEASDEEGQESPGTPERV